jgi:two-component system response regulator DesR
MITAIIADDAKLMRDRCIQVCRNTRVVEVIGEAETGQEAYDLVHKLKPELLLTDVQMLQMTGLEVARKLAAEGSETKIILVTSMAQKGSGGDEFLRLIKPFHALQMQALLWQLFGERARA